MGSLSLYSITTLFVFVILATIIPSLDAEDDQAFVECSRPFSCGILKNLSFPFWSDTRPQYCGHEGYKLKCNGNGSHAVIFINELEFQILGINQSAQPQTMTLSRMNSDKDTCPTVLNYYLFRPAKTVVNVTLLRNCPEPGPDPSWEGIEASHKIQCTVDGERTYVLFLRENETHLVHCQDKVEVPVPKEALHQLISGTMNLSKALMTEFNVQYFAYDEYCLKCQGSGGRCGSSQTSSLSFACYCRDRPYDITCGKRPWVQQLGIGIGCAVGGILLASTVFFLYQRRRKALKYARSYSFSQEISLPPHTDSEKGVLPGGVHSFNYNELERATNKFDFERELGDGGFGTVYYGKLRDGRPVAVKRLYENNYRRVEQFWNEIEILGRLRHPNLVSLYGYTSRHSRELLLVYEYICNGTVADHLHGERAKPGSLAWSIRLKIAIETASALEYLHALDIIHRDVKTDNILLDENFCVKVADFGLSRLFPLNATHVSTAPQGTPGYVDPEYHECYQLTDKSDVFSFGVVLIELISSMPAVDITRHRHEINLSNMAINKIQNQALHELVDPSLGFESDDKIRTMITSVAEVAFQCLQGGKEMRPRMGEVHEALKEVQSGNYNKGKIEMTDISADEVVSLKSGPLTLSPDSVAVKWVSNSSTSNASI